MAQPEVGSSGWKTTARPVVSGAPPTVLENPEDRVPSAPSRTHNCIRSPRIGSEGWARAGRRVPVGGRTRNGFPGGLPRAVNSRLRTGTDKGNPTA
ncbi:Unknown protein [Striga hermonthica]|uniref:Uncharacterized protein n=1 Tax=Striga hermonthica TaxID=68872 RepID=A0A9N7N6M9_STRHE|nr:Unknown protein [Striga hermonthica]